MDIMGGRYPSVLIKTGRSTTESLQDGPSLQLTKRRLCERKMSLDKHLKLFNSAVTPTVSYGSGCWTMTKEREQRLTVARRRMLRKMAQVPRWRMCGEEGQQEDWVSYVTRATHTVEDASKKAGATGWVQEQRRRKWRWAGHVARLKDRKWT